MGYAYTPGLSVAEFTQVRKVRRLPLKGQVLVQVGQRVKADDVVAQTELPGEVKPVNVAGKLGVAPEDLPEIMLKKEGDTVKAGEAVARTKGFFGLFKSEVASPIDGFIESISHVTGQVIIRGQPTRLQKLAYAEGVVVDVQPGEAVTVEVSGTFIQGIFGVGGEAIGQLEVIAQSPDQVLDAQHIQPSHRGKVLVGGGLLTAAAVRQAAKVGVAGIVCGGLNDADLRDFLGYELGVAITGEEQIGVTIVVTEGFGSIGMAKATFELLKRRQGALASVNGATQIRAGVIRPEVVIPVQGAASPSREEDEMSSVLQVGTAVRAIREPHFGRIGRCTALPVELVKLPSETRVRVLEVEFDGGERVIVPRANVELIKN